MLIPFFIVLLTAVIVIGAFLILVTSRVKIQLNISQETIERDQKPTLQALSYRTVHHLEHTPVSYYDLAAVAAVTGQISYDIGPGDDDGGQELRAPLIMDEQVSNTLKHFSENSLAIFASSCFDYSLADKDGEIVLTELLSGGTFSTGTEDNCEEFRQTLSEGGLVSRAKKGYSYLIPLPPFRGAEPGLTAQFIYDLTYEPGASQIPDAERPFCLEEGAASDDATQCCSKRATGGKCA